MRGEETRHILMIVATKVDFSHLALVQTESLTARYIYG